MGCKGCIHWVEIPKFVDGVLYQGYCSGEPNIYLTDDDYNSSIGCDYRIEEETV
jgi:hypothetical protein